MPQCGYCHNRNVRVHPESRGYGHEEKEPKYHNGAIRLQGKLLVSTVSHLTTRLYRVRCQTVTNENSHFSSRQHYT